MFRTKKELKTEVRSNMREGRGDILITHLVDKDVLGKYCRLFATVKVKPGDSIGKHPHHGETEIYFFLSGQGKACDDDKIVDIQPGDVLVTPDGHSHSVENTGDEDLIYLALILKDDRE